MNVNVWFVNERIIIFVVPLLIVPTELTEYTEAYGLKLLESTERIDAARHTTEGTELIACVASPRLAWFAAYGGASNHFCGFLPREA